MWLDLFFHIRSLSDTETLKDAICDILADRPPRDLAEGGHGLLHVREHGVRCDAEAEAGFRPFDGAGGAVERAELARVGQEGAVTGVFAEEPALEQGWQGVQPCTRAGRDGQNGVKRQLVRRDGGGQV